MAHNTGLLGLRMVHLHTQAAYFTSHLGRDTVSVGALSAVLLLTRTGRQYTAGAAAVGLPLQWAALALYILFSSAS